MADETESGELDRLFDVPFRFWLCRRCPPDRQSVERQGDNAR